MGEWARVRVRIASQEFVEKRVDLNVQNQTNLDAKRIGVDTPGYLEMRSGGVALKSRDGGVRLANRAVVGTEVLLQNGDIWSTPEFTVEFVRIPSDAETGRALYQEDERDRVKRVFNFGISFFLVGTTSEWFFYSAWRTLKILSPYPWGLGFVLGGFISLFIAVVSESFLSSPRPLLVLFRYTSIAFMLFCVLGSFSLRNI